MFDLGLLTRQFYDNRGREFSATRERMWPEVAPFLDKLPPHARVLDLGCGNGRLLTSLPKNISYLGLDFSETLLEEARRLHPQQRFISVDLTRRAAWRGLKKFDAVFCLAVLHHLDPKDQLFILSQIKHHLKPGGFALISVWRLWQKKFLRAHLKSLSAKIHDWHYLYVPFQETPRLVYAPTARQLKKLARRAGFTKPALSSAGDNLFLHLTTGVH